MYRDLATHPALQYLAWICLPVFLVLFAAGFVHILAPQAIGTSLFLILLRISFTSSPGREEIMNAKSVFFCLSIRFELDLSSGYTISTRRSAENGSIASIVTSIPCYSVDSRCWCCCCFEYFPRKSVEAKMYQYILFELFSHLLLKKNK